MDTRNRFSIGAKPTKKMADDPLRPASLTEATSAAGVRKFERVNVGLNVTFDPNNLGYRTHSLDVSEMGLLVKNDGEVMLEVGDSVEVLITGIVADNEVNEQRAVMRVVRIDDDRIALTFSAD